MASLLIVTPSPGSTVAARSHPTCGSCGQPSQSGPISSATFFKAALKLAFGTPAPGLQSQSPQIWDVGIGNQLLDVLQANRSENGAALDATGDNVADIGAVNATAATTARQVGDKDTGIGSLDRRVTGELGCSASELCPPPVGIVKPSARLEQAGGGPPTHSEWGDSLLRSPRDRLRGAGPGGRTRRTPRPRFRRSPCPGCLCGSP